MIHFSKQIVFHRDSKGGSTKQVTGSEIRDFIKREVEPKIGNPMSILDHGNHVMSGTYDSVFVVVQSVIAVVGDFQIFAYGGDQSITIHGKCFTLSPVTSSMLTLRKGIVSEIESHASEINLGEGRKA